MGTTSQHGTARRAVTVAAVTAAAAAGLAGCGSHKHAAATPTTAAPSPPSSAAPSSTPTTAPKTTASVAPLTGLPVPAAAVHRPAVVIKIDNLQQALPQTGPDQADVVYEELVEGGLTRLAVVFQSQYPTTAGPVRSGRLTDEGIADDLGHPVLAYAGANGLFQPVLAAQPLTDVDEDTNPSLFVENSSGGREPPHDTYTDVASLAALDTTRTGPAPLWAFHPSGHPLTGTGATAASTLSLDFPAASVQWNYSSADKMWLRTQNGAADSDSSGARLSASNVIVQFIPYITSAHVTGEGSGADGDAIPTGQFVGTGTAWFLSGGRIVKGVWHRASLTSPTVYEDSAGTPIKLQPGRTWVELPPAGTAATVTP